MSRCAMCRRPFGLLELTLDCEGRDGEPAEICEECDAGLPLQLRPSAGYVTALLASLPGAPRGSYEVPQ